jgi:uncharacterized membrane protein
MKRYFITGLLLWVPLGITLYALNLIISTLDQSLLLLPPTWRPEAWLGVKIPGLGVVLMLLVILISGIVTTNVLGQRLLQAWEGLMGRIPVVKSIYSSVKQVSDSLLSGNGNAFRKVLLVHYPHPDSWSLAFQTNLPTEIETRLDEDHIAVFIPTTPSPVNGFYFFVRKDQTIELDMSVDTAFKYIVSMGVVSAADQAHSASNLHSITTS